MQKMMGIAVAICAGLLSGTAPASAQTACGPREVVVRALAERFGEVPVAAGIAADGRLLEILAAADGASWTALASEPGGRACVVAVGRHWQALPAARPGRDS